MLLEALQTARDLGRLHQVASVLIRHGLGDLVRRTGVESVLQKAGRVLHWKSAREEHSKSTPEHVREALEELGPTFVKAGQILADRTDLLPPAWTDELSRLQQHVSPVPWPELRAQLAEDLGADPETVFATLDSEPVAAASIAQVHRAVLPGGDVVALKMRRPNIVPTIHADLRLLAHLAETAEREMPELRRYRPRHVVRQLSASLRAEIDMRVEGRNAARLRRILRPHTDLVVPGIYDRFTTERLCVMQFIEGDTIRDWLRSKDRNRAEAARFARIGADAVLDMVLMHGFFHADPHPANLCRCRDGRLGIFDFGMVGRLSDARRRELFELLVAVFDGSEERVVDVLLDWSQDGSAEVEIDINLLGQDCAIFIDRYRETSLRQLDLTALLSDVAALLRENHLNMPSDIAMLLKVFLTLDNLGRRLDPDFVTAEHMEPFVLRIAKAQRSPFRIMRRGVKEGRAFLIALPRYGQRLMRQLRQGRIGMDIRVRRLDEFGRRLDRSANRLTVGMITAALIIGTAIAMTVPGGPTAFGIPLLGLIGFVSSVLAGLWTLWSIARSGKR